MKLLEIISKATEHGFGVCFHRVPNEKILRLDISYTQNGQRYCAQHMFNDNVKNLEASVTKELLYILESLLKFKIRQLDKSEQKGKKT